LISLDTRHWHAIYNQLSGNPLIPPPSPLISIPLFLSGTCVP
jgi:hypothetical protein